MSAALDETEAQIVEVTRRFVDDEVVPAADRLEQANEYPAELIERMKELGVFGLAVPAPYGSSRVSVPCFALVSEEISRGWMSLAGAFGGHCVVAHLLARFGTAQQRDTLLPAMATGELRAAMALTEPQGGSDLQAIRTTAARDNGELVLNGTKMWISNARMSDLLAVLCKTDVDVEPRSQGISIVLVPRGQGVEVSRDIPKLGYKGIESCEVRFQECRVPADAILGGEPGAGFSQMMTGLELGRIQVAARAVGLARAAFDHAFAYAIERESFGRPIWRHQSIGNYLAEMAADIMAARQLMLYAAAGLEAGRRVDLEAGMAKLVASEAASRCALKAMRIHGGYGFSTEYRVERFYRDAPLPIVGEGTNEIQKLLIARQLVARGGLGL